MPLEFCETYLPHKLNKTFIRYRLCDREYTLLNYWWLFQPIDFDFKLYYSLPVFVYCTLHTWNDRYVDKWKALETGHIKIVIVVFKITSLITYWRWIWLSVFFGQKINEKINLFLMIYLDSWPAVLLDTSFLQLMHTFKHMHTLHTHCPSSRSHGLLLFGLLFEFPETKNADTYTDRRVINFQWHEHHFGPRYWRLEIRTISMHCKKLKRKKKSTHNISLTLTSSSIAFNVLLNNLMKIVFNFNNKDANEIQQ